MHFVIAFVLMVVLLAGFGRVLDTTKPTTRIDEIASSVTADGARSPASRAGLQAGDRVLAVNGNPIGSWDEVSSTIRSSADTPIALTIDRDGRRESITLTPADARTAAEVAAGAAPFGIVGIAPEVPVTKVSVPVALWQAGFEIKDLSVDTMGSLVGMFSKSSLKSFGGQLDERGAADPRPKATGSLARSVLRAWPAPPPRTGS